jgi:deoxyribodipyrimidine photo-lyase
MDELNKISSDARVTVRRAGPPDPSGTCVVYWMQRAQRGVDNPGLDVAIQAANALRKPAVVFLAPIPFYPNANLRHYRFLNDGIADIAAAASRRNVGFVLRRYPEHSLLKFCEQVKPALVVGDENPMREPEGWRLAAARKLKIPLWTVDADVIVPSKLLGKAQYAAYTIRPRLQAHRRIYLLSSANPIAEAPWSRPRHLDLLEPNCDITRNWRLDSSVSPISNCRGGTSEGLRKLRHFVEHRLAGYAARRNKPEINGTSQLSPYLHFGHISPITVALAVEQADVPKADKEAFVDQLITWRELAINFVRFNPNYDNFESAEPWAHRTLARHTQDVRPIRYTVQQLEDAETHDPLWNAAQTQMVVHGWMHNYMRMYWAKKILEWTSTPAEAYELPFI